MSKRCLFWTKEHDCFFVHYKKSKTSLKNSLGWNTCHLHQIWFYWLKVPVKPFYRIQSIFRAWMRTTAIMEIKQIFTMDYRTQCLWANLWKNVEFNYIPFIKLIETYGNPACYLTFVNLTFLKLELGTWKYLPTELKCTVMKVLPVYTDNFLALTLCRSDRESEVDWQQVRYFGLFLSS